MRVSARKLLLCMAAGTIWTIAPASAAPVLLGTYDFQCVTSNTANCTGTQALGSQLIMEVYTVDGSPNQVDFIFRNLGPIGSSITDVYFDDGTLLGIASITSSSGVSFSQGASPSNLPGGTAVNFNTTAGFLADSNTPVQWNGVNPTEWLSIRFNLTNGQTGQSVINALALGLTNPTQDLFGGLRVGIHVQGLPGGGSESLITRQVPEPASLSLLGIGLLSAASLLKLRRKQA
jgi:hypothetical protein